MAIKTGDRIPEATLVTMVDGNPTPLSAPDLFAGKTVVLFAVPGAFTPTCSARHLPGFVEHLDAFREAGVDTVACMAVNDVYVMNAWSKSAGADGILMLADGNGDFSRTLGLDLDARDWFMGHRSQRFALVAEDGIVTALFVEQAGEFKVSSAENVLAALQ